MRELVPDRLREAVDSPLEGLRPPGDAAPGPEVGPGPGREEERRGSDRSAQQGVGAGRDTPATERAAAEDKEPEFRRARTRALIRLARAVDAIFAAGDADRRGSPQQMRELSDARNAFEKVRPYGWQDAEAAYTKEPDLAREAGTGRVNRAIRALQLESELRLDPAKNPNWRADRFVERWQKLDKTSQRQYRAGDMSGYQSTRAAMGDMAKSLQRDPQLESILVNRKAELGIRIETGRRLGAALALNHGVDLGRGRGLGL